MLGLILATVFFFLVLIYLPIYIKYTQSLYGEKSGNTFFSTVHNKGNLGEFKIFHRLEKLNIPKILMTNLYIPKPDGTTTEVDLIMISQKGIFVFESKNYSGWIFGNENHKNWTATYKNGKKYRLFNPIWQNKGHVSALQNVSGLIEERYYYSYIIFGDDATFKKLTIHSEDLRFIKRNQLFNTLNNDWKRRPKYLSIEQVKTIAQNLKSYELADQSIKDRHVANLRKVKN